MLVFSKSAKARGAKVRVYLMLLLMLLQHFSSFHKKSGKVSYLDSIILAQVLAIFPDFLVSFSWSYFALSFIPATKLHLFSEICK